MAVALGLDTAGDQVVTKDLVLGWRSAPTWKRQDETRPVDVSHPDVSKPKWLLVFDNADDLNVLHDFWPVTDNGSILVTSRDPLAKTRTHVPITKGLDLQPFSAVESGTFLRQLTDYNKPTDIALSEEIATRLSGLPLAIFQIAGTKTNNARGMAVGPEPPRWSRPSFLRSRYSHSNTNPFVESRSNRIQSRNASRSSVGSVGSQISDEQVDPVQSTLEYLEHSLSTFKADSRVDYYSLPAWQAVENLHHQVREVRAVVCSSEPYELLISRSRAREYHIHSSVSFPNPIPNLPSPTARTDQRIYVENTSPRHKRKGIVSRIFKRLKNRASSLA